MNRILHVSMISEITQVNIKRGTDKDPLKFSIFCQSLVQGIVSHTDDSNSLPELLFLSSSNATDFTYFHPFANTFSMPYYSHINMSDIKHSYGGMDIYSVFRAVPEPRFHVTNDCGYNHYYQVNVKYGSDISSIPASSYL
mgnify:CR=1 FL=1